MTKVSIIMPVYNASNFLEDSCKSVSKQTLKDIELICVDDGSTDNSWDVLGDLSEKYDFIKMFSQENQGSGKARNFGISQAQGEYIAFLDADDKFLDADALEKMYFYGIKNDALMVGANLKRINKNGQIEKNYNFKNTKFKYFGKKEVILPVEYGIPFAFYKNIYKRELVIDNDIKFPDLIRGQDPIFLAEILVRLDEIYVLNTDLYGYNHSVSGGVNLKVNTYEKKYDYLTHFKNTFDILKNNNFYGAYEGYKREFVDYILFGDNLFDNDLKKAFSEVFSDISVYFDEDDYGFVYLKLIHVKIKSTNFVEVNYAKEEKCQNDDRCKSYHIHDVLY